jgi:hypothetical protein
MLRLRAVFTLMTLLTLSATAQENTGATPTLITKSPFLPPGFQPPGRPGQAVEPPPKQAAYEFRGVYELGGTYYFNLYNKSESKGSWIAGLDGGNESLEIVDFDPAGNELVISVDGEELNLSLIETSDKPMPVAGAKPAPTSTRTVQRATTTTSRSNPVRRRVIRPSTRGGNDNSSPARRRVIRPNPNQ